MKKLLLIFISFMLVGIWASAVGPEYVVKQEFQDKTNSLGAQVISVKRLSKNLNTGLASVKSNVETLQTDVNTLKEISAQNAEVAKAAKEDAASLRTSFDKYKQKTKILLIAGLILIIIALGFVISIKISLGKKIAAAQKQIDQTNNMLIEQGKSLERKISVLSDSIAELKNDKGKKPKKE
jgi:TolA-binding protein